MSAEETQSTSSGELDERLDAILERFSEAEHGARCFREISALFKEHFGADYDGAVDYLSRRGFYREAVRFDDIPKEFWDEFNPRGADSPFPFLQGDLVRSRYVVGPSGVAVPQDNEYWQVLSRDCDTPKSKWIRVAPVRVVPQGKNQRKGRLKDGALFRSPGVFAMPPLKGGERGLYTDLTTPFFIKGDHRMQPDAVCSLTSLAWRLFSSVIVAGSARVDARESSALREREYGEGASIDECQ